MPVPSNKPPNVNRKPGVCPICKEDLVVGELGVSMTWIDRAIRVHPQCREEAFRRKGLLRK